MAWHLYIVPNVVITTTPRLKRGPKYAYGSGFTCEAKHWGLNDAWLVAADVPDAVDAQVSAQSDVIRIPDNLNNTLTGGAVTTAQNALEAKDIPAQWITSGMSYRTLLRIMIGFFIFVNRYHFIDQRNTALVDATNNLDLQFNQLPARIQTALIQTADSLGLDRSQVTATSTLREIFRQIGVQSTGVARKIGGIEI
jgi:hypothetical protein